MTGTFENYGNFVDKLFSTPTIFEEYVLGVYNNDDREEIMQILAKKLIQGKLKEELNFIEMTTLTTFKYSLINNLLFKEMASEWVSYAQENLDFTREDALSVLQNKQRIQYLVDLVANYFKNYKIIFVKEICETFIDLISVATVTTVRNKLIEELIRQNIFLVKNISIVRDSYHIRVIAREALEMKNSRITKINKEITNMTFRLSTGMLNAKEKEEYLFRLQKLEKILQKLEEKSLIYFSKDLKKIRNLLFAYLMSL